MRRSLVSVSVATLRVCRGFGCCRHPLSGSGCWSIAGTHDLCGTWPSSSSSFGSQGRRAPAYNEQSAQLTAARAEFDWLAAGSQTVQQQALRDFAQAMHNFFAGTHRRPSWRKAGVHEGFRQIGVRSRHIGKFNKRYGRVWVPKVGWVRFRWTRAVPKEVEVLPHHSGSGRSLACRFRAHPRPDPGPGDGSVVGVDRGVAVSTALSTGELLHTPGLTPGERMRLRRLQQRLSRATRGSNRRQRTKLAIAKLKAREGDRRRDWVEKTTTDLARRFDTIRVERLDIRAMTRSARGTLDQPGVRVAQKRGLNRAISRQNWGKLVARLNHKAPERIELVPAAYTSQRCSVCGHVAPENRKSQAVFACVACKAGPCNADVNAARNIAAGRAVPAQGDLAVGRSVNCEPQLSSPAA